jgi:hypothetical protein
MKFCGAEGGIQTAQFQTSKALMLLAAANCRFSKIQKTPASHRFSQSRPELSCKIRRGISLSVIYLGAM